MTDDYLHERWRHRPQMLAVKANKLGGVAENGRVYELTEIAWDEETVERMAVGRSCAICAEPFETPYPEDCICGFRPREEQAEVFRVMYHGHAQVGSSINVSDELDRLDDEAAYEKWKGRGGVQVPMWLPGASRATP